MFYFLCSHFLAMSQKFSTINEAVVKQQCQPLMASCVQNIENVKQQTGSKNLWEFHDSKQPKIWFAPVFFQMDRKK